MIFCLTTPTSSEPVTTDYSLFANQIVSFNLNRSISFSLKDLFDICRAICIWLAIDKRNVAIIQCGTGLNRTGLGVFVLMV